MDHPKPKGRLHLYIMCKQLFVCFSPDYEKIRAAVFWLRYISVVYGLLFVGCTVTSAMTTYYASSILTWPFNSVSGIWTGLMVCMQTFHLTRPLDKGAKIKIIYLFLNQNICCVCLKEPS